jgi:hypothetical protein
MVRFAALTVAGMAWASAAAAADCPFMMLPGDGGPATIAAGFAAGLDEAQLRAIAGGDYVVVRCGPDGQREIARSSVDDGGAGAEQRRTATAEAGGSTSTSPTSPDGEAGRGSTSAPDTGEESTTGDADDRGDGDDADANRDDDDREYVDGRPVGKPYVQGTKAGPGVTCQTSICGPDQSNALLGDFTDTLRNDVAVHGAVGHTLDRLKAGGTRGLREMDRARRRDIGRVQEDLQAIKGDGPSRAARGAAPPPPSVDLAVPRDAVGTSPAVDARVDVDVRPDGPIRMPRAEIGPRPGLRPQMAPAPPRDIRAPFDRAPQLRRRADVPALNQRFLEDRTVGVRRDRVGPLIGPNASGPAPVR